MAAQDAETGWCDKSTKTMAKKVTIALYRWIREISITEEEVLFSQTEKLAHDNWVWVYHELM